METKALAGERGAYRLAQPVESSVPATVQAILAARIDRLPPRTSGCSSRRSHRQRRALRAAPGHRRAARGGLRRGLGHLQAAEFLYETRLFPDLEYTFKHALTHEVAYGSFLAARRQALHAAAGRALEALYADHLDKAYDRLAHHYSKTDNANKAVQYLSRFAEKVAGIDAHAEAVAALEEALAHAERLPAEEQDRRVIDLVVREAHSLHFLGRRQETVVLLLQHRDRLDRLHEPFLAGQYYFWLGFAYAWLGHRAEAAQSLGRSLEEATRSGDEALMGRVHRALAVECVYSGRPLDEAVAHGRQAVSFLERTEDRFWLSQALFALSYSCCYSGDFEAAIEAAGRLDALGEVTGSRRARSNAALMAGLSHATQGDWEAGIKACERALELSPDPFETSFVLAVLGKAYGEAGDFARAIPTLEQAVQLGDQVRSRQYAAWFRTMLGAVYVLGGQLDKARELTSQALDVCTEVRFLLGIGCSNQVLGLATWAQGALAEAGRHLGDALQAFVSVHSQFEVGRTHFFLASLAYAQGDRQTAGTHLKEAHSLFMALRVPMYVERAEQLAREFGVPPIT